MNSSMQTNQYGKNGTENALKIIPKRFRNYLHFQLFYLKVIKLHVHLIKKIKFSFADIEKMR